MKIGEHDPTGPSIYDQAGGMPAFVALVERFYEGVESDPALRRIYPEDLEPGKQALAEFLAQYWGGPGTYSERRGHPRLRMRHAGFEVTVDGAQRWVRHMSDAIASLEAPDHVKQAMLDYTTTFAPQMINTPD